MEAQEQPLDLRDVAWKLRKYTWLIILPIELCLCLAAVYYRVATPVYESQILVAVDEHTSLSPALEPLVQSSGDHDNPRERVSLVDDKVHSRAFLDNLVLRLGINKDPDITRKAASAAKRWRGITADEYAVRAGTAYLGRKIAVVPGRGSYIRIIVSDPDPETARKIAGMVGDALVEESRKSNLVRVQARGEFSQDQIAVYEDRLHKSEEALRVFQETSLRQGMSSGPITPTNLDRAQSIQRSSEEEMEQLRTRIQAGRDEWKTAAGGAPVPELSTPRIAQQTSNLGELETSYAMALLRATPEDKTESDLLLARIAAGRQTLYSEIDQLSQALPGDLSAGARSAAAGIALDSAVLKSLTVRRDRLNATIATYLKHVERSPSDEMTLQQLKADVQASRDLLVALQKEATSSRLSEALATSALGPQVDVVEHPLLPFTPASPQPLKIFGFAALMGPVLAAGIVLAGERLMSVLRTLEQTEKEFGVRVIGTVPRIEGWSRPGSYLHNNWAPLAVLAILVLTCAFFVVDATVLAHAATLTTSVGSRP